MKTLIFNGSPRKNGDTAGLLKILEEDLGGEIIRIDAYYCNISPCIDCRYCQSHEGCSISDEMTAVYGHISDCDNIVIASPIYFSELTGPLLCVGSRLQTYFCSGFFRGKKIVLKPKKGAVILVGGGDGSSNKAESTAKILLRFMGVSEILPTVCSHNTNTVPAVNDSEAIRGIIGLAEKLNG